MKVSFVLVFLSLFVFLVAVEGEIKSRKLKGVSCKERNGTINECPSYCIEKHKCRGRNEKRRLVVISKCVKRQPMECNNCSGICLRTNSKRHKCKLTPRSCKPKNITKPIFKPLKPTVVTRNESLLTCEKRRCNNSCIETKQRCRHPDSKEVVAHSVCVNELPEACKNCTMCLRTGLKHECQITKEESLPLCNEKKPPVRPQPSPKPQPPPKPEETPPPEPKPEESGEEEKTPHKPEEKPPKPGEPEKTPKPEHNNHESEKEKPEEKEKNEEEKTG